MAKFNIIIQQLDLLVVVNNTLAYLLNENIIEEYIARLFRQIMLQHTGHLLIVALVMAVAIVLFFVLANIATFEVLKVYKLYNCNCYLQK